MKNIFREWIHNNIYNHRKIDGVMYFIFYIFIPIVVTGLSLSAFPDDTPSAVYSYVTILISALNCGYDAANRWKIKEKSIVNTKLFCVVLPVVIISCYCVFEILSILILKKADMRFDGVLCVYFLTVIITLIDIVGCFAKDMSLRNYVDPQIC